MANPKKASDSGGYTISGKAHTDGHGSYLSAGGNVGSKAALNQKDPTTKLHEVEVADPRTGETHVELRGPGFEAK